MTTPDPDLDLDALPPLQPSDRVRLEEARVRLAAREAAGAAIGAGREFVRLLIAGAWRIALDERKQAEAEARAAIRVAELQGKFILQERRARLYDLEIEKAQLEIEGKRQRLAAGDHLALPPTLRENLSRRPPSRLHPTRLQC